ncbi:hypothetical protein [Thermococcus thioreducens]|uniref:Uncharacterized protein n=1 Tax=Thermococcus thioreducens TaxID=277988 RepID=A0A0Q2MRR3_9EURY|nr:hypothetical protein [Thermococcus thioreducens]ASJ12614.1 hypothetical protein A3L14_06800 [Thermococcus thioreducens]KQH82391.1 hypothetical protein AMR53_05440 [Thermococcus thioreducens]SEV87881.1 hypothetical protein SAMN05216170_0588 [Thermococcus thioreducens]
MKRFAAFLLLALLLFTIESLLLPRYYQETPTAYGFFSDDGSSVSVFVPTARRVAISVVTENLDRCEIEVFDGVRNRFITNLTAMGNMYREMELPDSGTYYFVYHGNGTARIAVGTLAMYPSRGVLKIEYLIGGTVAFVLAALVWVGVRQ